MFIHADRAVPILRRVLARRDRKTVQAALRRSEMMVRLISVVFGFDLEGAAATFIGLGSRRWRLITLGGSEEPILMPSDGEMRSSTRAGCAGVSLLAAEG